jgi:Acetyltransferases
MAIKKCPVCKKLYPDLTSVSSHIETTHQSLMPKDWSGARYYFFSNHGRDYGNCIVCKDPTEFNEVTGKPERICSKPKCKDVYRQDFMNRMISKHGKACLLNDPEVQKKMLSNRSIAKKYEWSDKSDIKTCIGGYEYDFARFSDIMMNFPSNDIIMPAPMIIEYQYNGQTHFYIPDAYITSLNLIVEIKEGLSNPNTMQKIQDVDKVKEKCKEDALRVQTKYNYVKIEDKQYSIFVETMIKLKERETLGDSEHNFIPLIMVHEYTDLLSENVFKNSNELLDINDMYFVQFNTINIPILETGLKIGSDIYVYRDNVINVESMDNIEIVNSKKYNTSMTEQEYLLLRQCISDHIGQSINDDTNNTNFPFVCLYEMSDHSCLSRYMRDTIYSVSFDNLDLFSDYDIFIEVESRPCSEYVNFYNFDIDIISEMTVASKLDNDFKAKKKTLPNQKFIKITKEVIAKYKPECKSLSHVRTDNDYEGYVLLSNDDLLGYVNVNIKNKSLQAVYVHDNYRGCGIGNKLLSYAMVELGAENLSVSKKNEVAIKMYKNNGFEKTGEDKNMIYMSKLASVTESVENIDMADIEVRFKRTVDEIYLYDPNKLEKDLIKLAINAKTEENLEVIESYLNIITDQMKHTLFKTLIELKLMLIIVKNQ